VNYCRAYYAGGARVVIDGVPIRLARKPSRHNLEWSRNYEAYRTKPFYETRAEKAKCLADEAIHTIRVYAEMLGIDEDAARARIHNQREYLIANPPVDLSMEYDL
jgi:predicted dehydrogenase